jgi:hypothetical protein
MGRHARRRQVVRWTAVPAQRRATGPVLLGANAGAPEAATEVRREAATTPGRSDADGDSFGWRRGTVAGFGGGTGAL